MERMKGTQEFEDPLRRLNKIESEEKEKRDAEEKIIRDAEMHSQMFVEYLNTEKLFEAMYADDEEGTE